MFRRLFGFGRSDPVPNVDKTQAGDLENWTLNQELNRYEFTKNGYNYKRIPDILDPENRVTNDFYIKNAVEFTEIATYDLKGATVMIDGNLTVRAEVNIVNGIIDLMYGTGTSGREHELKMDHDFTFTDGEFKHVYAVRHFLNGTDDNMKGTLEDIHGLYKINDNLASKIIEVHGDPVMLRESLKIGNRSSQDIINIKDLNYSYDLILIQDSVDLDSVRLYGETVQLNSEDDYPQIISSSIISSITCNNLQFLSKMTIKNVEIHASNITFANNVNLEDVGIEDCTIYEKLKLTANTIKVFKGNTVFVEGFCVQVEDNKTVEIGMKMYNKGDMNGKNKPIENFAIVNGGSINIVRKTLHDNFAKEYQRTSEYITDYLKEGEKYTANTYVNYDVYIQWLTECIAKFGSFNIAEYKIGNTTYTENKSTNEFIEILKNKTNVQKVEILRAATGTNSITFQYNHQTNSDEYVRIIYKNLPTRYYQGTQGYNWVNSSIYMPVLSNYAYERIEYGDKCTSIISLRRSIIYDIFQFFNNNGTQNELTFYRTKKQFVEFMNECEIIAKCKILFAYKINDTVYEWVNINSFLAKIGLLEDSSVTGTCIRNEYINSYLQYLTVYKTVNGNKETIQYIDVLPLRYEFLRADSYENIPYILAQFYTLSDINKVLFYDYYKNYRLDNDSKDRFMFKTDQSNDNKVDFLTTKGTYISETDIVYQNLPRLKLKTLEDFQINLNSNDHETPIYRYVMTNYFYNYIKEPREYVGEYLEDYDTASKMLDTYENILDTMEVENTITMLQDLLNFPYNSNGTIDLLRDTFNRYITLKTNREEYYKCTLNDNGTEIEKSLLELDNVGSANSVTQVMTEHTATTFTVPLHTNPQTYYTKYDGQDNIHFNIKTADDIMNDMNNYLYDNRQNVYWGNTSNPIVFPNDHTFNSDNLLQYLIEDQFYSGKKIILNLRGNNRDEWCELDNLESRDDFLLAFWNSGVEISTGSSYHVLKMNKPMLSEGPLIPLHDDTLSVTVENAPNQPTAQERVNTLDALINVNVEIEGGATTLYTVENPWFKHYRGLDKDDIAADIQKFCTNNSDLKKRKEYVLEIQYFLGFPLYFSNTTGIYDLAHYSFEDTTINVVDPTEAVADKIYYKSGPEWSIIYNTYQEKTSALFELPLATEEHIDMRVGKELFNYLITEILSNSWIDDPMPAEVDTYEARYPSTFGLDITMRKKDQTPEEAKTLIVDDIRKDIDVLFDKLKKYREDNFGTTGEMTCTVLFKSVRPYGTLEGKLPLHENSFNFDIDNKQFSAIIRSFNKKVEVKDNEDGLHLVDNPWFDKYNLQSAYSILGNMNNYKQDHNPSLEELKEYLLECEYYAGRPLFYTTSLTSSCDLAYLDTEVIQDIIDPYKEMPTACYEKIGSQWLPQYYNKTIEQLPSLPFIGECIEDRVKDAFKLGFVKLLENSKLKAEDQNFPIIDTSAAADYNGTVDSDIVCNFEINDGETQKIKTIYDEDVHLRDVLDHLYDDIKNTDKITNATRYYPSVTVTMKIKDIIPYNRSTDNTLHSDMSLYEAVDGITIEMNAVEDMEKFKEYTEPEDKKKWLKECIERLPAGYEAFIKCKVDVQGEEPIYKFVRLEDITNVEGTEKLADVPEALENTILFNVTKRFYKDILEDHRSQYTNEGEVNETTRNETIGNELKDLFTFDKKIFLERAKQMLIFYCTEDGKLKRQINFRYSRSEAIIIIKRGAKTIKFTEENADTSLLQLINELESSDSINYNTLNLTDSINAELEPSQTWYVMPKYLNLSEQVTEDEIIIEADQVLPKFDEDENYKYGLEDLKYRYTQREIFDEIDDSMRSSNGIAVLRSVLSEDPENIVESFVSQPRLEFPRFNTLDNTDIVVFTLTVSEAEERITASFNMKYLDVDNNTVASRNVTTLKNWIIARLFAKTNYPIQKYDLKYKNAQDEDEIVNLSELVISDDKEIFDMKGDFVLEKIENTQQLPLIPENVSTPVEMFNVLKGKKEEMTDSEFETYAEEYLAEMYQRARNSGVYIYFIRSVEEDLTVIPMSEKLTITKENVDQLEIFSVNPTLPNEPIISVSQLLSDSKLNYTKGTEGESDYVKHEFYIAELVTLYAKRISRNKINSYGIKGKRVYENNLHLPVLDYPDDYTQLSDFLIKSIKTNEVYSEFELEESEGEVIDFFNAWKPNDGTEHSAVSELSSTIALFLNGDLDAMSLKLYFYSWQLKAGYLNFDPDTHEVTVSKEPATSPVTFKLSTTEYGMYRRYDIEPGEYGMCTCCEGFTVDMLVGLDEETLRSVLTSNTYINPYPYRIAVVSDIEDDDNQPDDGEEEDPLKNMYILKDEDQNETRGWIYTGLIKRLITKYLNGSLKGTETSWDNITDREMMSNDEMSNIITLLNTRYNNEIEKAENIPELYNILAPESGNAFGIIDTINLILNKEQTYDRRDVRYSEEEIRAILDSIERWYVYYEPDTATFLETAEIMIWEGMDLEYYTVETDDDGKLTDTCRDKFASRVDEIVTDYNKIFNKYSPANKKEWEKTKISGLNSYYRIAAYDAIRDSEWLQFIQEVQGIRNTWQFVTGAEDNRILLCIGTNYGEMWSVFGRQPGDEMPLETYFYLKNTLPSNGSSKQQTREITNDVIYIPRDKYNSNLKWNDDKYFHSNLYQLLFYPYYLMINDTSKFKDYINPVNITEENININYLGYILLVPKKNN